MTASLGKIRSFIVLVTSDGNLIESDESTHVQELGVYQCICSNGPEMTSAFDVQAASTEQHRPSTQTHVMSRDFNTDRNFWVVKTCGKQGELKCQNIWRNTHKV